MRCDTCCMHMKPVVESKNDSVLLYLFSFMMTTEDMYMHLGRTLECLNISCR
jgi:hypothetical protein